jgi:hypothetical protein
MKSGPGVIAPGPLLLVFLGVPIWKQQRRGTEEQTKARDAEEN